MVQSIDRADITMRTDVLFQASDVKATGTKGKTTGKVDGNDTVQSAQSPSSNENKETWGAFIYRIVCCPFTSLAWVAKKLVYCLTLGYCCNDKVDPKEVSKAAKEAFEKMKNAEVKEEDKHAAFDAFFKAYDVKNEVRDYKINHSLETRFQEKLEEAKDEAKKSCIEEAVKAFDDSFSKRDPAILELVQTIYEGKAAEEKAAK